MDSLTIVERKYLAKLQKRAGAWKVGWVMALVMLGFACLAMYGDHQLVKRFNELNKEFKELQEKQKQVDIDQKATTLAFVTAWENQQSGIRLVISWADYIKQREELGNYNRSQAYSRK